MPSAAFLVPGSLNALTGGSIYDRRMVEGLRALGWTIDVHELDHSFPEPTSRARADAADTLSTITDNQTVIVDGLAFGAMPDLLEPHGGRLKLVALVHMPLALEVGIDAGRARLRQEAEGRALALARAIVVTGHATRGAIASMGLGGAPMALVEPGCDHAPLARGSGKPVPHLLCVAAVVPGKGHEGLIRALDAIKTSWTLTCAGSLSRDRATAERVRRLIAALSLTERVALDGEANFRELADDYDRADVFVLNTRGETYGMAVSEAIAHGLPVVSTRTGAIPDLVGDDAGMLVGVDDEVALQRALATMIGDATARARCRAGAAHARERLRPWSDAARQLSDVITQVSARV